MQQLDNSLNKIGYIYSRKLLDFNNQSYLPNSEIKVKKKTPKKPAHAC